MSHYYINMLSSDKNVESIAHLIEVLKDYFILQKEFTKYDIVDKLVRLLTVVAFAIIVFVMVLAVLFYLSFAAVYWMAPYIGMAGGFAVVAAFFLIILLLVSANRKKWIEGPLARTLAGVLLEK